MYHIFRIQNRAWIIQFTIISKLNFQFQSTVELAIYLCGRSFPSRLLPVDSAWLRSNAKTPSWTSNQQSSAPEIKKKNVFKRRKKTSIFKSYTYSTLWIRAFVEPTTKPPLRSSSLQVSYRARTIFNADTNCSSAHHIIIINITLPVRRWVLSTYL